MNQPDIQKLTQGVETIIVAAGDDLTRGGLQGTPERVAKAWAEWLRGYRPHDFDVKRFQSAYEGLVVRAGIPFQSFCEHHMARYHGTIDFAYIPKGWVIGLSKIIRLAQWKASRLTIQETLTDEISAMFRETLETDDVAVVVRAFHSCESTRGVKVGDVPTITAALKGRFFTDSALRAEFYQLTKGTNL
jgi:GTP cyclohydrolase I